MVEWVPGILEGLQGPEKVQEICEEAKMRRFQDPLREFQGFLRRIRGG